MPDDEISYGDSELFVKYSVNYKLTLYFKFKIFMYRFKFTQLILNSLL